MANKKVSITGSTVKLEEVGGIGYEYNLSTGAITITGKTTSTTAYNLHRFCLQAHCYDCTTVNCTTVNCTTINCTQVNCTTIRCTQVNCTQVNCTTNQCSSYCSANCSQCKNCKNTQQLCYDCKNVA